MTVVLKHQLIMSLPEDRREQVTKLLRDNKTLTATAQVIQVQWGLLVSVKPDTLQKALARWREDQTRAAVMTRLVEHGVVDGETLKANIDVLNDLALACALQKSRLARMFEREQQTTPLEMTGRELERYTMMLERLGKVAMASGVMQTAPNRTSGTVRRNADGSVDFNVTSEGNRMIDNLLDEVRSFRAALPPPEPVPGA